MCFHVGQIGPVSMHAVVVYDVHYVTEINSAQRISWVNTSLNTLVYMYLLWLST